MLGGKLMKKLQKIILGQVLATIILLLNSEVTNADQCARMETEGHLIYQQLKRTKICKESAIGRGWTDCNFKAYGTELLLVGSIGTSVQERIHGVRGSGFYVLSVDKVAQVRTLIDDEFGTLLLIEGKDNLKESGCIYNKAYITLDAQVYDPGEFNEIKLGPIKLPKTEEEKTKALQDDLRMLGYYAGDIDGVLGSRTITAIEQYKKTKGLPKETAMENVRGLIAADVALKYLDKMKEEYEKDTVPKPPLRK
jgi:hypothetical protein